MTSHGKVAYSPWNFSNLSPRNPAHVGSVAFGGVQARRGSPGGVKKDGLKGTNKGQVDKHCKGMRDFKDFPL